MKTRAKTHRRFRFEPLERRTLLAGDVNVSLNNGELVITGDNEANEVTIFGTGIPGQVAVFAPTSDVFFNGQLQVSPFFIGGVTDIVVDLNAGDDSLLIEGVAVDSLSITTDEGADRIGLGAAVAFANGEGATDIIDPEFGPTTGSVGVNEGLTIDMGAGADVVQAVRVFGGADWNISLGDDNDTTNSLTDESEGNDLVGVALDDQAFVFVASADSVNIQGETGDDLVNVAYLTAFGRVNIDGGAGNDVTSVMGSVFNEAMNLYSRSGIDTIAVDFCRFDGDSALLEIDSGADDDFVLVARSVIEDSEAIIRTGQGTDRAVLGRFFCGPEGGLLTGGNVADVVRLDMGSHNDVADIRGNIVEQFFGALGGGDDDMTVAFNVVNDFALLDGGGGADDLFTAGNLFDGVNIVGYEGQFAFTGPAEDACTETVPGNGEGTGEA